MRSFFKQLKYMNSEIIFSIDSGFSIEILSLSKIGLTVYNLLL